jgi:hypothetical protein
MVVILITVVPSCCNGVTDHFVYVLEHRVDGLPLLLLFSHVVDCLESDTLKLEEDTVRKVKVALARLHDQVDKLLHVGIVALQVERDQLRDVKF